MKKTVAIATVCLLFCTASTALANNRVKFNNIEGKKIDMNWYQVEINGQQKMRLTGKVRKGQNCKQLNIKISLDNSKNGGDIAWFTGTINNYKGKHWNTFRIEDTVYTEPGHANYWHFDKIYFKCYN